MSLEIHLLVHICVKKYARAESLELKFGTGELVTLECQAHCSPPAFTYASCHLQSCLLRICFGKGRHTLSGVLTVSPCWHNIWPAHNIQRNTLLIK